MDIPKLLPLAYCKLDKAAKLLGCEIEDILHWGAIRAINICVKDVGSGTLIGTESFLSDEKSTAEYVRNIYSLHLKNRHALHLSPYTNLSYNELENDLGFDDPNTLPDNRAAGCLIHGGGFWALDFYPNYYEIKNKGEDENGYLWLKSPELQGSGELHGLRVKVPNYWHGIPTKDDFYIIKPDLDKLYDAIHGGGNLESIYNNKELAQKEDEQKNRQNIQQNSANTRISSQHKQLTVALLRSLYGDDQLSHPYKLHDVMGVGLTGYPIADGGTLKDIIKKGGWMKFDE